MPTQNLIQLVRFAVVGVASNVAGYALYLLVTYAGAEPKKAMTVLYLMGATVGYIGNRQWSFSHRGAFGPTVARYALAHLAGYLLNLGILITFVDHYNLPHQAVQAVAIVVVAAFLFLTFKWFVFSAGGRR